VCVSHFTQFWVYKCHTLLTWRLYLHHTHARYTGTHAHTHTHTYTHTHTHTHTLTHSLHRYYWLDAGWFVGGFPAGVGNWEIPLSAGVNRAQYVTPHLPPLQTEDTSASILYRLSFSITLITLTILDWCGRNTRNPLWKF
jgi:hypothetical protein